VSDDPDDDDEAVYLETDVWEFCAVILLIYEGVLINPTDQQRGSMTLATWAQGLVLPHQFDDAVRRIRTMDPDKRGTICRAILEPETKH
jgi:hypothetical protein